MGELTIRDACEDDLAAIDAIYNHYVLNATCTWQCEPNTAAQRRLWLSAHDQEHPVTVAVLDGEVVGWGSLSVYNVREGYRFTVENTVYVHPGRLRRGVGRALLTDLVERARGLGHRTIVASISADQEASVALHRAAGFVDAGRLRVVGFKFGQWLDCVYLQKLL
ncbi:MAG: phosphinothricin acetyltransferase [Myxococcales bacterium]|nr:phosphinothricin acetyltransferase [Myxococcales bacterium]